jgi:hypothetical protein
MGASGPNILPVEGGRQNADHVPNCLRCGACEEEVHPVLGGGSTKRAAVVIDDVLACELLSSVEPVEREELMTHKYRGSQQSSREVLPNLLIRHKGSQRIYVSLNR